MKATSTSCTIGATVWPPDSPFSTTIATATDGLSKGAKAVTQVFLRRTPPASYSAVPVLAATSTPRTCTRRPVPCLATSCMPLRTTLTADAGHPMSRTLSGLRS